jgi:ribulose-5-phosphate 4-epimerase/fuculose-1-phosphate aldolase
VSENSNTTFSAVFLDKTPPVDLNVDEMILWGKKIHELRPIQETADSLSFRTKMGFIITGSGIAMDSITKDAVAEVRGVVFGLNRPSIYIKGQVTPSGEALLHSDIYEALPEINAIICLTGRSVLETAQKFGMPSTDAEQPAGSQELAQQAKNTVNNNKSAGSFILKNYGVITLGTTMAEAGKLAEEILNKHQNGAKAKTDRKK